MGAKITISPTVASGLGSSYVCTLPAPRQFSVTPVRAYESARSISGAMLHSVWPSSITTARPRYQQQITEAEYTALRTIYDHATVTTWMLGAEGRVFEVGLIINSADRVQIGSRVMREIDMEFLIVREVTL
ncbi:MAG: hypothetical protein RLZZ524_368 [Pseudomonadota bacterium]|jgi:hypothetical protein